MPVVRLPIRIVVAGRVEKISLAQDRIRPPALAGLADFLKDQNPAVSAVPEVKNIAGNVQDRTGGVKGVLGGGFVELDLPKCRVGDSVIRLSEDLVRPTVSRHSRSEERRVGKECRSRWSPY